MRPTPRIAAWFLAFLSLPLSAQQPDSGWDVTQARGRTREIDFTTNEGTWMSADVSPDGKWVVFDLLAHVYRVPIEGGTAECLTQNSGVAVNFHPRYSPDGKSIAFISDRKGQNNLWVMDADGSNPRAVYTDRYVRAVEPAWSADGRFIYVRRTSLPRGTGGFGFGSSIWMYHREGGDGVEIIAGRSAANPRGRAAAWPSPSRDGKYLYFHEITPGETPAWTTADDDGRTVQDVLQGGVQLTRLELATNAFTAVTSGLPSRQYRLSSGGGYAGEVSPDGKLLTFARRIPDGTITFKGHEFGPRTALWIRDLETGAERVAMDPIEQDMVEGMKVLRVLPGYGWTPDGRSIVIASGGKLRRLEVARGRVTTIPFTARVRRTVSEQATASFRISDEPFPVRFARWHTVSPDGRRLAFQAVGRTWVAELTPGRRVAGQPRRLTPESFTPFEHGPAWSPDGQWLAFTTVDETSLGHLWRVRASGGAPEQLTPTPGEYNHPAWSADGREIVVARGAGASGRSSTLAHSGYHDVVVVPAAGGAAQLVTRVSGLTLPTRTQFIRPTFGRDGRIYFQQDKELVSVRKDGSDRIRHLEFPNADEIVPSPNGAWVAFNEGDNVHVVAVPIGTVGSAGVIKVDRKQAALPVVQVSRQGGLYPRWRDSVTLELGSAARYIGYHTATRRADTADVALTVPRALARGTVAFTNARIVTLDQRRVIDNGTIVIKDGRITCVGRCATAGANRTINARGKTIIPGLIDIHSHHFREYRGVIPPQAFEASVPLAFGVTTSFDNSMWSQDVFPAAELIEAGALIGPRTYSTGDPLYLGDGARQNDLTSYQVTEENITRLASWGAIALKQYLQPRRDQRQWVADVARKQGLMVTGEGDNLEYNVSLTLDGQTGWEHPLSYVPLYGDVAKFFGQTNTLYSPTFMVGGPGPWNDEYFFGESEVWKSEKLRRWTPWQQLVPHARRRALRPATDYSYGLLAQGLADIIAEGGQGGIGSHGQQHGLASHWEVWVAASAMGPMGALELATWRGAKAIGVDRDVGSLAVGKLGDLLVLNSNPLTNIRSTADIQLVVKGGVVYDAETLDEQWPRQKPYGPRPWVNQAALERGPRPVNYWDAPPR
ncbi:MAG: amidohydrolase family protein [Gemmatimonadales bacterium]